MSDQNKLTTPPRRRAEPGRPTFIDDRARERNRLARTFFRLILSSLRDLDDLAHPLGEEPVGGRWGAKYSYRVGVEGAPGPERGSWRPPRPARMPARGRDHVVILPRFTRSSPERSATNGSRAQILSQAGFGSWHDA